MISSYFRLWMVVTIVDGPEACPGTKVKNTADLGAFVARRSEP